MKKRLALVLASLLGAIGFGSVLSNTIVSAQQDPLADPYPVCQGVYTHLEAEEEWVEPGQPVHYRAHFSADVQTEYDYVTFNYQSGNYGQELDRLWQFGGGETLYVTFPITPYARLAGQTLIAVYTDQTFKEVTCVTRGNIVWTEVGYRQFLPLISKN